MRLFLSSHPRAPCIHRFFQQVGVNCKSLPRIISLFSPSTLNCPDAGLCNSYLSEDTLALPPQTCVTSIIDNNFRDHRIIGDHFDIQYVFSDDNMNLDEKAKLVTNENFYMTSDERNCSRINLNKQPDRTLSSFLSESQFYENLQIMRWV